MAVIGRVILYVSIVYLFLSCFIYSQDDCHPETGPPGESCVLIPNYDNYQLAECASPSFVVSATNSTFQCMDQCRNYCWLPCMAQRYGALNGSINASCECSPDFAWCSRATGSCNFFTGCLNAKYNCGFPSFAVFGRLLCEIITGYVADERANCTDKEWMRDFRVCLQSGIIPDIYSKDGLNCTEIERMGFDIVNSCFRNVCLLSGDARTYLYDYLDVSDGKAAYPSQVTEIQGFLTNCTS